MPADRSIMRRMFGESEGVCKDCSHFSTHLSNRKHFKCEVYGESASAATDWRAGNPACGLFNRQTELRNVYKTAKRTEKRSVPKGQLSFFEDEKEV